MDKIGLGVIGAGGIADRRTIPAISESKHCELVAMMDVANQEALSNKYGKPCYESDDDLLAHPDVQAVYIASPVYLHFDQIKKAALAGKHILCEKPLCLSSNQARQAGLICEDAGVCLKEGYMMRYHGAHRKIMQLIESGRIGRPVYARAQLSCWYPPIEGAWRQIPEKGGGGALIDMATHLYDLLEMFLGKIVAVGVRTNTQVHDYPVEDSSTTLLQFESGTHATVDAFFCIPDNASRTRLEIYGSQGAILSEGTIGQGNGGTLELYSESSTGGYDASQAKDSGSKFAAEPFDAINPYAGELDAFAEEILSGDARSDENGAAQGAHILEIVEAAYESAKTDRFIELT